MTLFFSACFLKKAGCPIFQKAGCPIFKNSVCRLTGRVSSHILSFLLYVLVLILHLLYYLFTWFSDFHRSTTVQSQKWLHCFFFFNTHFYPSVCFTHGRMRRTHVKKEFKEDVENENSGCLPYSLFVTSKSEFSNSPFLQFTNLKCCKMSLKSKNKA